MTLPSIVRIAAGILAGSLFVAGVKSQTTLTPAADGYVRDGTYADTNFGTDPLLMVKGGPTGSNAESFIRFDLSGQVPVNSAALNLSVPALSPGEFDVGGATYK